MNHTPGPWLIATSNSWRRILSQRGQSVCEPIQQNDGHPDLYFRNGGEDGPDARLLAAAPQMYELLERLATHTASDDPRLELVRATRALLSELDK